MTIKKWILFFLLPILYCCLVVLISIPLNLIVPLVLLPFINKIDFFIVILFALILIPLSLSPFAMYLYAKIFGLFSYIDSLGIKFYKKMLLVFLISFLLFLSMFLPHFFIDDKTGILDLQYYFSYHAFSLIQSFFIYKLLQHLTQKHPVPFKALAYYFSVEFYKSVAKKLFNKLKSKSKRD